MEGIRNNNPLNIRYSPRKKWKGQIGSYEGFCMFDTLEHGYHAALVLLCEDHRKGYNTVRKIINHWATETEKDIKAYISAVMGELSGLVDDDGYLPESSDSRITNLDALSRICFAMSQFECGYQEVDDAGGYEALFDDALPHFKYPSIK